MTEDTGRFPDRMTLGAFALMILIGGFNSVAVRFSNFELPPFWGAGSRFALATGILFLLALISRAEPPTRRALAGAVLYGFLAAGIFVALVYWALVTVTAGLAAVMLSLIPLATLITAVALGMERLRWQGLAGTLLAVGGVVILFYGQLSLSSPLAPLLALVAGIFVFAGANVVAKRLPPISPFWLNAIGLGVGSVVLLLLSFAFGETWRLPVRTATWIAFLYLIAMGSVLFFVLLLVVIRRWTASGVAHQFVVSPVVAILAGALLADEPITPLLVLGAIITVSGVYVGALRRDAALEEPPGTVL